MIQRVEYIFFFYGSLMCVCMHILYQCLDGYNVICMEEFFFLVNAKRLQCEFVDEE